MTQGGAIGNSVVDDLLERLRLLEIENAQLREALERRIVIEQAKGSIAVRSGVPVDVAFELIRGLARSQQRDVHEFAAEIVANGGRFAASQPRNEDRAGRQASAGMHAH